MQKKVLIPLLMTPIAFPALADINIGFPTKTSWDQYGATGDQNKWEGGSYTCTVGTGSITTNLEAANFPVGKYKIVFSAKPVNCYIKVNGDTLSLDEGSSGTAGYSYSFKITGDAGATLEIGADDKSMGFSFVGQTIKLVFDAKAVTADLQKQLAGLNDIALEDVNADDGFEEADKLRNKKSVIENKLANYETSGADGQTVTAWDNVWQEVLKIGGTASLSESIATYKKYGFYKVTNDLQAYLTALGAEINTYNEEVLNENTIFDKYLANLADRTSLLDGQGKLVEAINTLINDINTWEQAPDEVKADLLSEAEAQKTAIEDYEADIKKAFPYDDDKWSKREGLRKDITFASQYEELNATNTKLNAAFNQLKANYNLYYEVNFILNTKLENEYNAYIEALNAAKGVDKFPTVYEDIAKSEENVGFTTSDGNDLFSNKGANAEYNTGKGYLFPEGAWATVKDENKDKLEAVITKFTSMTEALNNLVETQNENMTTAQQQINDFNAQYSNFNNMFVDASFASEFYAEVSALGTAINTFSTYVDGKYEKHILNLDDDDYTSQIADINKKINDINTLCAKAATVNNLLIEWWEPAVTAVKNLNAGDGETATLLNENEVNIIDKWQTGFDTIKNGILALTKDQCDDSAVTDAIKTAISDTQENAENMAADFVTVIKKLNTFNSNFTDFTAFVNGKEIKTLQSVIDLKAKYLEDYAGESGKFYKELVGYKTSLNEAKRAKGQDSWDLLIALKNKLQNITELQYTDGNETITVSSVEQKFAYEASKLNGDYAQKELNAFIAAYDQAVADNVTNVAKFTLGTATATTKPLETELTNILAEIVDTATTKDLGVVDGKIIKFLDKLAEYNKKLTVAKANQAAYDSLVSTLDYLQTQIDNLTAYNENTSLPPALEYYGGEKGVIAGIQSEWNTIKDALEKSLADGTVVADMSAEEGYTYRVQNLIGNIANTRMDIEKNNKAHNDQIVREKEVRTYIESVIAAITKSAIEAGLSQEVIDKWTTPLRNLIDNDIAAENVVVTNEYGKGNSNGAHSDIMAEYQRIEDLAQDQYNEFFYENGLHKAVETANNTTTGDWNDKINSLLSQYRDAIKVYNTYYYGEGDSEENHGWRAYIHDEVKRHETLFKYYQEIHNLDDEGKKAFAAWTADNHVITNDEYQEWKDKCVAIHDSIEADLSDLWDQLDSLAAKYYDELNGKAETAISDADKALTNAGIDPEDYLKEAISYLAQAHRYYDAVGEEEHLAKKMDEICNELDEVAGAIDLQKFAEDAWTATWEIADKTIKELKADIASYDNADPDVKAAVNTAFQEYENTAIALNQQAIDSKDLINEYKEDKETLDAIIENLQGLRDEVKKINDLNVEDQTLQNNFYDKWLPDMNSTYEALVDYCNSLSGCAVTEKSKEDSPEKILERELKNIREAIELLEATVKANLGRLGTAFGDEGLEGEYEGIIGEINKAYTTAYDAEVFFLRTLLNNTKVAFNDAYEADATLPEGETYPNIDAQITKQGNGIDALGGNYDSANPAAQKDELVGYETELCRLYVMLKTAWGQKQNPIEPNPATALLDKLNNNYNTLKSKIDSGKATLDGCMDSVQEMFAGEYEALQSELDDTKVDWSDDGDRILAREGYYTKTLNEIETALNELNTKVAAEEQKAQEQKAQQEASDNQYAVLYAQYEELLKEFEDAKTLAEGYGYNIAEILSPTAERIQNLLDDALAQLESDKAAYALTAESTLLKGDEIESDIAKYKHKTVKYLANAELSNATEARNDANDKLTNLSIVPAVRAELKKQFDTLNDTLENLQLESRYADDDRLAQIAEEAKALVEEFKKINDSAQDNSFVVGDVDLDENGEVNVLDVQMLINFIGEGMTYDELYAENPRQACAADVDGNDKLNVADVTSLISMILGDEVQVVRVKAYKPAVKSDDSMSVALVGEEDGVRTYAVALSNMTAYTAAQFDIRTSGDAKVTGVATVERTEAHDAYLFDNYDYSRVILASMQNAVFTGQDGTILFIQVEGKGDLTISDAMFTDTDNNIHEISKAHTSTLDAIYDYVKDGVMSIYDAAGRRLQSLKSGINIIRHKDGSVTKEMRK
ncbi:MAG: hypothetical protein NC217_03190 [Muribaculaceae bacterium]|nr:hypothetical protein [Muribaculaceae bacterium]